MGWREENEHDDAWQATPAGRDVDPRRTGWFVGPLRVTPTRVTIVVALVGSAAFLLYALTVRESSQIPLLSSGVLVLGLVFAALGVGGGLSTYRAARDGDSRRAFAMAVMGGLSAVVAFVCFTSGLILALVYR